ncbi:MAG: preprotein translocase subunit Sec61beta [Candidatus Nanoarchaeia archaeon]|jgi:preprotein translocase subunit Sec61beta|nr:preprotein translocase subunit Sec61beta [Candidatus Nanoarchaeia archaeon]|tara:strand:- start:984 stop:1139 length:156 start_codon:yes stop_codon:yes gene_type:complete
MAKKNRMRLPSSQGGLVNYYDENKAHINISPKFVIGLTVVITILAIAVRLI